VDGDVGLGENMKNKVIVAVVATILGLLRFHGVTSLTFQAIAHIFEGWMFGLWYAKRSDVFTRRDSYFYLAVGVALAVVEVACFLIFRFHS
jgi:hypothetical protein